MCIVDGCSLEGNRKGMCQKHYDNNRRRGNPLAEPTPKKKSERKCQVFGCSSPHLAKGYCSHHYHSVKKYGAVDAMPRQVKVTHCIVDYCSTAPRASGYCARHYNSFKQYGSPVYVDADVSLHTYLPGHRVCTSCLESKHESEFGAPPSVGKPLTKCKSCTSDTNTSWRRERMTPESKSKAKRTSSRYRAIKNYGESSIHVWERMQSGEPCEACGEVKTRMAIDHCHDSNKVRGLLCSNCNTALGLLNEDVERMKALIQYIESHQEE